MTRTGARVGRLRVGGAGLAATLAAIAMAWAGPARADFVLGGVSSGGISFGLEPAGAPQAGGPVFDTLNALLSAGNGYPLLGNALVPFQTVDGGYGVPAGNLPAGITGTANPALIAPGFGTGSASLISRGGPNGGGIFWTQGSVSDPGPDGLASVNVSAGNGEFVQQRTALTGRPGVSLSVTGNLGNSPGAFVEASLVGTFIEGFPVGPPVNLGTINVTIASDGAGPLPDFVSANAFGSSTGLGTNLFSATGVSFLPQITLAPGDVLFMFGTLTLVADPMSFDSIQLSLPDPFAPLPDFGVVATPEPSSVVLLGLGLAAVALRRARRVRLAPRPLTEEVP